MNFFKALNILNIQTLNLKEAFGLKFKLCLNLAFENSYKNLDLEFKKAFKF
ncbi:hypothetical protein [Campylobacter troglodytis]|uniref:hypothetical protein n=1 Tax=Campylobacter troglodytis TaxID=654363 RepID=UPI00163BB93B|nr:hypothetical protein [Campylobacter troglodytis]